MASVGAGTGRAASAWHPRRGRSTRVEAHMFRDRADAGKRLAVELVTAATRPCVVAAIPRGGVAVAMPIVERLEAPLTVAYARRLTAPLAPELAFGRPAREPHGRSGIRRRRTVLRGLRARDRRGGDGDARRGAAATGGDTGACRASVVMIRSGEREAACHDQAHVLSHGEGDEPRDGPGSRRARDGRRAPRAARPSYRRRGRPGVRPASGR